jgi:hypothetical protein
MILSLGAPEDVPMTTDFMEVRLADAGSPILLQFAVTPG